MTRVCFQLQVRPDRLEEYRARHAAVWPDMLAALPATGWHNYSLFLREDGLLIGYVETPSIAGGPRRAWPHRGQRPLAGRDGRVLRRPRRRAPDEGFLPARGDLPPRGPARRTARAPTRQRLT